MTDYYYNRKGEPITCAEWSDTLKREKRVAETHVSGYWVSTVYLGLNHGLFGGPPLIFETMVFPTGPDGEVSGCGELDSARYSTEEEARAGHARLVEKWSAADGAVTR